MADGPTEDHVAGSRTGRMWPTVCAIAVIGLVAGFLGRALIDSGRSGTLRIAAGSSTFTLTLPDAEEAVDLATILDEALGDEAARRASTIALLRDRHGLYEFGASPLIDRIRRLDPTTESEYTGEFLGLVRNRQGPFQGVRFDEIPPPQSIEVLFWSGIGEHHAAVCERSRFHNQWVRLVNAGNNERLVLYASSVLVREDCPNDPNARIQINIDQGRALFGMADLPRSRTATASLNPAEPPF